MRKPRCLAGLFLWLNADRKQKILTHIVLIIKYPTTMSIITYVNI